jgi:hypothetical protein
MGLVVALPDLGAKSASIATTPDTLAAKHRESEAC